MAKSNLTKLRVPEPLEHRRLLSICKQARAQPNFSDPFPQKVGFHATYKEGMLPSIAGTPDYAATKFVSMNAKMDAAQLTADSIAKIIGPMVPLVPSVGRTIANTFGIECRFGLPGREDKPQDTKQGHFSIWISDALLWFHFLGNSGFSHGRTPGETQAIFAAERRYSEELLNRVIAALRLPLRLVPAGKSFGVEHTASGELRNYFEPEEYGTGGFSTTVPGGSPLDLARHMLQGLEIVRPLGDPEYSCSLTAQNLHLKVDPCQALFEHLQAQRWPVLSSRIGTMLRIDSPTALAGLAKLLPHRRIALRMDLAHFRDEKAGRKPVAKLTVQTRADGNFLGLNLAAEYLAMLPTLQDALGLVFQAE